MLLRKAFLSVSSRYLVILCFLVRLRFVDTLGLTSIYFLRAVSVVALALSFRYSAAS